MLSYNFSPVTETILTKLFIAVSLYTTPVATMTSLKKHTASDQKLEAEKAWEQGYSLTFSMPTLPHFQAPLIISLYISEGGDWG